MSEQVRPDQVGGVNEMVERVVAAEMCEGAWETVVRNVQPGDKRTGMMTHCERCGQKVSVVVMNRERGLVRINWHEVAA